MTQISRRRALQFSAGALAVPLAGISAPALAAGAAPRVVVVGGGFGGATAARLIRRLDPAIRVTLVERARTYTTCPMSNLVLAGARPLEENVFTYKALEKEGIKVVRAEAAAVDAGARAVVLADGTKLPFDRAILAPGIDFRYDAVQGFSEAAAERMPHAWKAGAQTTLLRRQLEAMDDGGTVVISVPGNPYRCPPGPYERASLIAHYLAARKPRSKILILDGKDNFSKQTLFENAWAARYPNMIQWISKTDGGAVTSVDPKALTAETDFGTMRGDVFNLIPPQTAGRVAVASGATDKGGWCPVDPVTFESRLLPGVHVIGDATVAAPMPKSATAATSQAHIAAQAVVDLLRGRTPPTPILANTCYSLAAPDYGISVTGVYAPGAEGLKETTSGVSAVQARDEDRALEAAYCHTWFAGITKLAFA
ncbi:MAG TPA: NAD(P)/FAD-dependent oxidoreductase [Azospirillaceae bacterium]|nr:NAD(P)/FAD-dependent oxidoreductase [Azospirillaceae bacterium]